MSATQYLMTINGRGVDTPEGIEVINPANGQVFERAPHSPAGKLPRSNSARPCW
jgi:hypothetical protein